MNSRAKIFSQRAENEVLVAEKLKTLSENSEAKEFLNIPEKATFYSSVISHSYYAIFYAAKAILLKKGIITYSPEIHRKTFEAFRTNLVDSGMLDLKLLEIYKKLAVRADDLLDIFRDEKRKRGIFTYQTIPQANKDPAEDSLKNAKIFVSNISKVMENI